MGRDASEACASPRPGQAAGGPLGHMGDRAYAAPFWRWRVCVRHFSAENRNSVALNTEPETRPPKPNRKQNRTGGPTPSQCRQGSLSSFQKIPRRQTSRHVSSLIILARYDINSFLLPVLVFCFCGPETLVWGNTFCAVAFCSPNNIWDVLDQRVENIFGPCEKGGSFGLNLFPQFLALGWHYFKINIYEMYKIMLYRSFQKCISKIFIWTPRNRFLPLGRFFDPLFRWEWTILVQVWCLLQSY